MNYPEHEKLAALNGANTTVGQFIEWLGENRYMIVATDGEGFAYVPKSIQQWVAEFFEIDQDKLENEKRHMLEGLRIGRGENP